MVDDPRYWPEDHTDLQVLKAEMAALKAQNQKLYDKISLMEERDRKRLWTFAVGSGGVIIAAFSYVAKLFIDGKN